MKQKLLFLLKYYLFWIVLSIVAKIIFLLYQGGNSLTFADYWQIFYKGLRMDLSLGGYVMMLFCILSVFTTLLNDRIMRKVFTGFTVVLLFLFWFVVIVDLELFKNWGYHIDATPLLYLKTPKEAMASTPEMLIAGLLLLLAVLITISVFLFRKIVLRCFHYQTGQRWQIPVFLILGAAMLIPVRGGFNVAPMNSSFVFFHNTNMYANQAAINPVWNFIYEVTHVNKIKNKFNFMAFDEAQQVVDSLLQSHGDYPRLLTKERPNVVVVLLESFTANAIEVLGGEKGVTPNLNKLAKEGVLFSNIYAAGNRSDRGMLGVISAYPSHPNFSLLKYPNKTAERPRFSKEFEKNGYHTRFYYAGDINFGGFRSYVTMAFQDIVTEDDFSGKAEEERFKWGIHDEFTFERLYEDMTKASEPFLYMVFNMSSHEPFVVPMETKIKGDTDDKKFMNAIYYSDSCIGNFIDKCKESGIWDNTLFVFIADHGLIRIGDLQPYDPAAYHIPLILAGGVLNVADTVVSTIGSQTDMVATLLAQLGIDHSAYKYSKNLLADDVVPFAFYSYSNAIGMITEDGISIYNLKNGKYIEGDSLNRNNKRMKAYLQVLDKDVN